VCIALASTSGEIATINTINTRIDQLAAQQHAIVTRLGECLVNAACDEHGQTRQNSPDGMAGQLEELSLQRRKMNS
jgi:hypothetical protein